MKNIFILMLMTLNIFYSSAQDKLIEEMVSSTVLLEGKIGSGSGIFINDTSNIFFVTARHVLFTESQPYKLTQNNANLIFYPHNVLQDAEALLTLDIKSAYDAGFVKFDTFQDIAVINIGKLSYVNDSFGMVMYYPFLQKNKRTNINHWPVDKIEQYNEVPLGGNVYVFGYPSSIGLQQNPQFDYRRPLLRKGNIAGKYEKLKTIIIDCPVYFGNSGGPVFEIEHIRGYQTTTLVGIISQYIPYVDRWVNSTTGYTNIQTSNSNYSIVVSIEYVIKLIKSFK